MQLLLHEDVGIVPSTATFEARVATDCWAYGKLLAALAQMGGSHVEGEMLHGLALSLTDAAPESRFSLDKALMQLEGISR